ncbi:MAG: dinitrogenase iron-molybdenum cofactor biosynthesis protein [Candidatus Altiarchaeales archaeon]|nr:dinitrogenase iron-molybdenum cofactor biosynthesis protein [Candidatus Altiarchaeales archaeon]MBD3415769.1 dinitrogenase iron-molybdenum cofactor biosynthesis protein [Candidatus Altiarchaeales archaeon]
MRVAVPSMGGGGLDDRVGEHFGRTPTYTIVDSETWDVTIVPNTSHHRGGERTPPELLADEGVEAIVCSGLGRRAVQFFREKGIKAFVGAGGDVRDAVSQFNEGALAEASDSNACKRHAFKGESPGPGCEKK